VIDISSGEIVVANARKDTVTREVLRHSEFEDKVQLGRVRDHFLCKLPTSRALSLSCSRADWFVVVVSLESAGQYKPERLIPEAIKVLLTKIQTLRVGLQNLHA